MDPIEALKQIRTLISEAEASDDLEFVRKHLEMVRTIVDTATTPATFQKSVGEPKSGR